MNFNRLSVAIAALVAQCLSTTAIAAEGDKKAWFSELRCAFVSYDKPGRKLTVRLQGLPDKQHVYVAASLDRGPEGGLWVQAGSDLTRSGDVELEAYDFSGKAIIYAAKNGGGRGYLEKAQKGSAKGKPSSTKAASKAAVSPICEFDIN